MAIWLFILMFSSAAAWVNNFDQPVHFECDVNEFISGVKSIHDNHFEDREWDYSCRAAPHMAKQGKCIWDTDVNEMDQLLSFRCHGHSGITGVTSRHDNHFEDRVFGFRCCELVERKLENCKITEFINNWDGLMNYHVPDDYVIAGFESDHNNHFEDRRWKAEICEIVE